MQSAFSKRQLDILRNAMVQLGATALSGPGYAKCRTCVGGQTVEMTCSSCDKVKGLDEFAKAQRHNPDTAVSTPSPAILVGYQGRLTLNLNRDA